MTDLADFLLARIAEDEAVAREAAGINGGFEGGDSDWCPDYLYGGIRHLQRNCDIECSEHEDNPENCGQPHRYSGPHMARWDPARALAECDAKRQIVELYRSWDDNDWQPPSYFSAPMDEVLAALALPYASHPDYDEKWRP